MADPTLSADLTTYLARPVTGERLPATYSLSVGLVGILQRMAQERGAPVDALVEHALFKALRGEHARQLVGEKPDPIPASFLDDRVAQAKVQVALDVAAIKDVEGRGDKAARVAAQMEAMLADASEASEQHIETLQRSAAVGDAKLDAALEKSSKKPGGS
jgi:hypothetical protein